MARTRRVPYVCWGCPLLLLQIRMDVIRLDTWPHEQCAGTRIELARNNRLGEYTRTMGYGELDLLKGGAAQKAKEKVRRKFVAGDREN